ncbi:maleylpyruvate isomerase N-terminal domain-containing protein [Spiractinospora alimapuensis]|uniref:maleylpyruvate isomerase N-terminal domain-containing protein n=1 Tax=Spiractinospora alimapuensis TaxID=2820884 RepID=UPI001F204A5C|nr:maleylpyruvate isomerase N-terminal domain-containing protein [Spiractinospora alimapuensis]QVQ53615.1 maleylpyruvate isomerase N-terminal domain-containing protein [Spiractinospora alimapuensis]
MDVFSRSWDSLRTTVRELSDEDFGQPSGCAGWLVRDVVCHLVLDAQDVLITLATPTTGAASADAASYWDVVDTPPTGEAPLDALVVRLAAAYQDPRLLIFHLDDVGAAAGRAARRADPDLRIATKDRTLTVRDYLSAYVLEWTLHHLDLVAFLPDRPRPHADALARSRALLELIAGTPFPPALTDTDALLVGTGRRSPTPAERSALGDLVTRLPLILT